VDGGAAVGTNAGGGSGGTLIIDTKAIDGDGRMSCDGGHGNGHGGSGAGGRMKIQVKTR
jgi:hypothetical protein